MSTNNESLELKNSNLRPFSRKDKFSYAAGDFGCNMSFALGGTFFALFYTQYIGIKTWIFSLILIGLKIWDAINDPLIGAVVDRSKAKTTGRFQGKFKRFIFIGAIGLIFSAALTFLPIPNAELWVKITVCIITYMLWDITYTLANVPYGAMAATITADPVERSQLSIWRNLGAFIANIIISIGLPYIIFDEENNLRGSILIWIALILGLIGFLMFIWLLRATVERVEPTESLGENLREKTNYLRDLKAFFANRGALGVTFAVVAFFLNQYGAATTVTVLFQSYFNNAQISGIVSIASFIPMFLVMPFVPRLVRKFGKKAVSEYGLLFGSLGGILLLTLPITPDMTGIYIFIGCNMVSAIGLGFFFSISYAMVSDSIDYTEWKDGNRKEGAVYAWHSFFRKAAQGLGPALVLLIMVGLGYNESFGAVQTFQTDINLRYLVAALNLFGMLMAWVFIKFVYNIDKKTVAEMEAALGHKTNINSY